MSPAPSHAAIDPCREALALRMSSLLEALSPGSTANISVHRLLEKPPDLALGDFAFPCFRFAKALQKKPQDIAKDLAERLSASGDPWIVEAKELNAFVNIRVNPVLWNTSLFPRVLSGSYFAEPQADPARRAKRVMVEYSQPNTHKEFHVGHVRNVCLGASIVHLYRYAGYPVVAANYLGDEGAHVAKCIWYILEHKLTPPDSDHSEWFGEQYVAATRAVEEATGEEKTRIEQKISTILRDIETQTEPHYSFWRKSRQWSLDDFQRIYQWFDAPFDVDFYESDVSQEAQKIVDEYLQKGVFEVSDGAVGCDLKAEKLGFALLRKRDGNTLYATKDLALARRKFEQYKINRSVYVVGNEQNFHFRQVFKTLEKMGFPQAKDCFHLSYSMVTLPEGKMSSRLGNTVTFKRLREAMLEELLTNLQKYTGEWSAEEIADTGHRLCAGAIKYGMLATDPNKNVVFDMEEWLSFEGNTGPYLMYAYSRTQSVLRKAKDLGLTPNGDEVKRLIDPLERGVIRHIYDFNDVAVEAAETYRPTHLASHLYYLCKEFNRFYKEIPILKAEEKALAEARLALVTAFAATLKQGLALLGMTPPARM